jgi:Flp pilus assembly protein TadG
MAPATETMTSSAASRSTKSPHEQHAGPVSVLLAGPARMADLLRDKSGASAIIVGLLSMGLLGFAALGTEVSYWYFVHRDLQNAADSAALSASAALQNIPGTPDATHKSQATAEAKYAAQQYGFTVGTGGVQVTVNIPPQNGNYKTTANAVEVILSEPQQLFLSAALSLNGQPLFATNPTQSVRAVATPANNGNGCVVTLDRSAVVNLFTNGNTQLNIPTCDLYVNSNATNALDQVGNATITAEAAYITGGITSSGNAALTTSKGAFTGTAPINDPYAGLTVPYTSPGSSCSNANPPTTSHVIIQVSGGITKYTPDATGMAIFCGGWNPSGSVSLDPGLYVVDGGTFGCNGCTITGNNVTIYLTGSGTTWATLSFSGNGTTALNINAPTNDFMQANPSTKALEGIAIFGDRNGPTTLSSSFSGNATATINGVIYMPTQNVTFNGNGASTPTCSQIVSFTLVFHGNSSFSNNCSAYQNAQLGTGVQGIGAIPAHLVE